MPPIQYTDSPQTNFKQKARRLAQASIDRRGMESLPNPQQMKESFDVSKMVKQSNENFTPMRNANKYKMSQLEID